MKIKKGGSGLELEKKIKDRSAEVGVIGLGYVGLPLALAFSEAGFRVTGFDIQQKKVAAVNQGESYLADVASQRLSAVVAGNRLRATTEPSLLKTVDAICICVPTPLTRFKEPDLSHVTHQSEEVSRHLQPGQLLVLESTTYPGTTRELVLPILESSGLRCGENFYLAYSPERIDPGNRQHNLWSTPKIVGGIDSLSTKLGKLLYQQVSEVVVTVSSPEIAEMTKVFENVFRSVNIALVNELAQLCERMGISAWEVISAAATKPYGYMPFYPGVGIGGHCIPLDPYYLASKAREYDFHTRFIELAAEINEQMPYHTVSRIADALNGQRKSLDSAKILVLGVTYKKDIGDIRESPSLKLIQLLKAKGSSVRYNDPHIPRIKLPDIALSSIKLTEDYLSSADCVVIATDHTSYDYPRIASKARLLFDTRGVTKGLVQKNIIRLGE